MIKFPLLVIFAAVALNVTAFAILLQMDWLIFQSPIAKVLAWAFTAVAWVLAFRNRNKFYVIRLK